MRFENKRFDLLTPSIVISIMAFGIFILRSAVLGVPGNLSLVKKQIIWDLMGIIVMFSIPFFKEKTMRDLGLPLYVLSTILLIAVLFLSPHEHAKRWFDLKVATFQPSEISKIALVLFLPAIILKPTLRNFVLSLALTLAQSFLVVLEPDLGTAVLLSFIWFSVVLSSKVKIRYILTVIVIFLIILPLVYSFGLKDYQRERITAFLNPEAHSKGAAYNVVQSMNAIGSGGLLGRGYMRGPANLFGFVPVDHTDFIIAVVGEELGFFGVSIVVVLYALLLFRIYYVHERTDDEYWKLVLVGVGSVFFFHVLENLSMCVGLAPVTGIPLPFISYGGSSTLAFSLMSGIVMKVHAISNVGRRR